MTLKRLEGSDYHVADESVDIRGWKVMDQAGVDVGTIDTLLFDPDKQHVVYAVVDLQGARRVLVPISMLAIEQNRCRVVSGKYDRQRMMALRAYEGGHLGEEEETIHYREHATEPGAGRGREYSGEPFRHQVPDRIRTIESRLGMGAGTRPRELSFSGTEPTEAELAERERLERERQRRL